MHAGEHAADSQARSSAEAQPTKAAANNGAEAVGGDVAVGNGEEEDDDFDIQLDEPEAAEEQAGSEVGTCHILGKRSH